MRALATGSPQRRSIPFLLAFLCLSLGVLDARAAGLGPPWTFTVLGEGITSPTLNGACADGASLCLNQNELFDLNGVGFAELEGSSFITVDGVGAAANAAFNIAVPSFSFTRVSGASGAGIVETIDFLAMTYSGTATVNASGDPTGAGFNMSVNFGSGVVAIDGFYRTFDNGGTPIDAFTALPTQSPFLSGLNCNISLGFGQCDIMFTAFDLTAGGVALDVNHQLTLHVDPPVGVPEPAAVCLLGLAFAMLVTRRAPRTS